MSSEDKIKFDQKKDVTKTNQMTHFTMDDKGYMQGSMDVNKNRTDNIKRFSDFSDQIRDKTTKSEGSKSIILSEQKIEDDEENNYSEENDDSFFVNQAQLKKPVQLYYILMFYFQ